MLMDVMSLRRMVMAQMASGAQFVKGTFTAPSSGSYTLNFGKTFSKYIFIIESTEDTKTAIINSGASSYRPFYWIGSYPQPEINNNGSYGGIAWTYKPSTNEYANSRYATDNNSYTTTSITFVVADITGTSSSGILKGCSYNYYIVEIK